MNKILIAFLFLMSGAASAQMPLVQFNVPKSSAAEAPDLNPTLKQRDLQPLKQGEKKLLPESSLDSGLIQEALVPKENSKAHLLEDSGEIEVSEGPQY